MKCSLLLLPFVFLLGTYVYFDPALVLRHHNDFNRAPLENRDFISTQAFLNNNPTQHYQSFILGNSRSGAYYTHDWAPHINDPQPYHFDASAESLYGVYSKVQFLNNQSDSLTNVLIVWDRTLLKNTGNPSGGPLFMKDSRASDNGWLEFNVGFVKAYFSDFFFFNFLKSQLVPDNSTAPPPIPEPYCYQPVSNDMPRMALDIEIARDSAAYYQRMAEHFQAVTPPAASEAKPVVLDKQREMLQEMAQVFQRHGTNYQIVISPLFDKLPLHHQDVTTLRAIFGSRRVHDYSGVNKFTSVYQNYYESSHYRPLVARQIMQEIYAQSHAKQPPLVAQGVASTNPLGAPAHR